jgi:hypothetical protein
VRFLIIVAAAAGVGYYAYKAVWDEPVSCGSIQTACMQKCRRTTTEAPAARACQDSCQSDAQACEREKARAQ